MDNCNILYVDDEIENLTSFKFLFKRSFQIILANSATEGLQTLEEEDVQIVISDQRMPNMTGIEFLEKVSSDHPEIVRILLTGYTDTETTTEALTQGKIDKCMSKPFELDEMKIALLEALELYKQRNLST
ncbi:MAG: response regulator [Leptospiraceae bacterium]|nr:response regulator [Leptospiraceae bacterium]